MLKLPFLSRIRGRKGFTLIEIVIVVAIIGLLASLSIVLGLNSYISANEAGAQQALETLRTAMEKYRMTTLTYPADLATLGQSKLPYIDSILASGSRRGYNYTLSNITANTYTVIATPAQLNITGKRTFQLNQSGEIIQE